MIYSIDDKFIVQDVVCTVVHVNLGKAWVAPIESDKEAGLYAGVAFEILNEKGLDSSGEKAVIVNNIESMAV